MKIGLIVGLVLFVGLVESSAQQESTTAQAAFLLQSTKLKPALGVRSLIRVGSNVELGDLNQEWKESLPIAERKPDLKTLDAEVRQWFDNRK